MKNGFKKNFSWFLALGFATASIFAAGCKGPDGPPITPKTPPTPSLTISDGEYLVTLKNKHNPTVTVDAHTWGFNDKERDDLITELETAFENLNAIVIGRLADLADKDLTIDKFGVVKGLKPSVEWYIDFIKGPKENGMHIAYFPPEDIKSLGGIITDARAYIINGKVPNTPDTWADGLPPSNAGGSAAELMSYEESMLAGMIPQNTR